MGYVIADWSTRTMVAVINKGTTFPVGNLLTINKVRVASHGANHSYLLTLEEISQHSSRKFDIDFTEFNATMESANKCLSKNGYVISFKFINHLREYLTSQLQQHIHKNAVEYYHTNLGFTTMRDDSQQFLLDTAEVGSRTSIYIDESFQFQAGSKEEYLSFLVKEILPYFEMRLALTLGLASVVSSDLKEHGDLGTIVLNLTGQSSTGKTTTAQLMASLWGCPKISNSGIVRTFNATTNSLVQTFTGINGVPIIIDDASSLGLKDMSSFIYNIAAGEDKLRLTSDIQLRDTRGSWSGLVAISSESSMMDHSTKTSGSVPRIIEFDDIVWTQNAQHAKTIKRAVFASYGHLGSDFVKRYLRLSKDERIRMFNECEDELEKLVEVRDQFTSRILSKLATFHLTAKLIEQFYQYPSFSADEIRDYLLEFENGKVASRSMEAQALEIIKDFIVLNQHRFACKSNRGTMMELSRSTDFIGYKTYVDSTIIEITVLSKVLRTELYKNGIHQWSNVLRYLEQKSFVKTYGKNNKASETDNYLNVKAVTFKFFRENQDTELIRWYFEGASSSGRTIISSDMPAPVNRVQQVD